MKRRQFFKLVGAGVTLALVPVSTFEAMARVPLSDLVTWREIGNDYDMETLLSIQYQHKGHKDYYRHALRVTVRPEDVTEQMRNIMKDVLLKKLRHDLDLA